jgi:TRAP-type mannitol/chloroaromatic compound transport system permease large subunit
VRVKSGILVPPSVVLVLYVMIARANLSGSFGRVIPGPMMAALFIIYIVVRRRINPALASFFACQRT